MAFTMAKILAVEDNAEDAFLALMRLSLLAAETPEGPLNPDYLYKTRDSTTAETPRIELQVTAGAPTRKHDHIFRGNPGLSVPDQYEGELRVTVTSNRTTDTGPKAHGVLLGQVRAKLVKCFAIQYFATDFLFLVDIWENASTDAVDDSNNLDMTTLSFYLMLQINPAAWPLLPY